VGVQPDDRIPHPCRGRVADDKSGVETPEPYLRLGYRVERERYGPNDDSW